MLTARMTHRDFGGLACTNMSVFVAKNSDRWLADTGASSNVAIYSSSLHTRESFVFVAIIGIVNESKTALHL